MKRKLSPAMIQKQEQMRQQTIEKEYELLRSRIFLLPNRIDNEMSMFQLISGFGERVKLSVFIV